MTTIVIDFANKALYADKRGTCKLWNNTFLIGNKNQEWESIEDGICKIHFGRFECGKRFAVLGTGSLSVLKEFVANYPYTVPKPTVKNMCTVFVVTEQGCGLRVTEYTPVKKNWWSKTRWEHTTCIKSQGFLTAGSGGDYAYGALMAGVSPDKVFDAVALCDKGTSSEFDKYTFGGNQ